MTTNVVTTEPKTIAQLRAERGLTQADLCTMLGVAQSQISAWERMSYRPIERYLELLARALEVSKEQIIVAPKRGRWVNRPRRQLNRITI